MFQPIRTDPPPDQVRRITFVPFLTDGRCVLIDEPGTGITCTPALAELAGRPPAATAWITGP